GSAAPLRGSPRVAIVGAGIAGLSAALALRDRGVTATVYEAQHRIGGRMHSESAFWDDGQVSEYGGELIDSDHTTIRALAKRYGLTLTDVLAGVPANAEQTIFQRGAYYRERQLFQDFRPVRRTLAAQVAAAGYVTTYDRSTAAGRELDAMSLTAWIERYVPGGLRSDLGTYIELQYVAEYGIAARDQSSLNMIYWLGRQPQYDERTGAFVTLGPSDERYHILGGNQRLPRAIAAGLGAERVLLGHRLEAIARRPDGRIALTFERGGGTFTDVVDKAIVTVPFSVLRRIELRDAGFDARKLAAIRELGYGDHSKLIVQFDERFWRGHGKWPGVSSGDLTYDGPFVQTWEATRGQSGRTGMLVDFAAASGSAALHPPAPYTTSLTPQTAAYAKTFATELERVLPGATAHFTGKATLSHVTSDPFARGSYSGWLRGQYTRIAGYERVRQGNVLFAGEHCSVILQGFMEGAAREGARAAHEVLRDAGIPVQSSAA
ncbi:MAG: FAD-dependent oxidoreductase, partial [Candidatus Eremiobacteraeota bacterium]|nr:FAD-dependent oxidoreductase [Candidatus Eremiobacteraeota bacterium]